jgi:hypothetical protein
MTEPLKQLLTQAEFQTVTHIASERSGADQLPLVAWALGFVTLDELAVLLEGGAPTLTVEAQTVERS